VRERRSHRWHSDALKLMRPLRDLAPDELEFFAPASFEQREWIANAYCGFELAEYLSLLAETDGIGEMFSHQEHHFVHNMLIFNAAEAIKTSEDAFQGRCLAIGAPGVDGILFVLQPSCAKVFAYDPIDCDFTAVASSVYMLLEKWVAGDLRL
jgi:hypothetical protein